MDRDNHGGVDDSRGLQALALNLSLLGLENTEDEFDSTSRIKSSNTTECVPVPSSEHVAEIVGRQGCKIKALRAKTNTYIKTPVRGEDPVFVVTGRKEDVVAAKREILQAAEHFSQIRARRSQGQMGPGLPGQPPPAIPGQTMLQVRVPYRVVGLVVGPKGATIKRIQQQTNTYIVTPSRDNEPVFEVTGLPENVESAKKEIEAHIAMRTGGQVDNEKGQQDDFATNGTDTGTFTVTGQEMGMFTPIGPFNPMVGSGQKDIIPPHRSNSISNGTTESIFNANNTSTKLIFNQLFNNSVQENYYDMVSPDVIPDNAFDLQSHQLGSSNNLWQEVNRYPDPFNSALGPQRAHSFGSESQLENSDEIPHNHKPAIRLNSDPLRGSSRSAFPSMLGTLVTSGGSMSSGSSEGSLENSPSSDSSSNGSATEAAKKCTICEDKEIIAALVPCGHNLFCMDCANQVTAADQKKCPVCHEIVTQAIRIIS